jgi:hypothetical protein
VCTIEAGTDRECSSVPAILFLQTHQSLTIMVLSILAYPRPRKEPAAHDHKPGEGFNDLDSLNETRYLVISCYLVRDAEKPKRDQGGDQLVPAITAPHRLFPEVPADDEERDDEGVEQNEEANAMQHGMKVGGSDLAEEAQEKSPRSSLLSR